jgi:hypothetical protein
VIDGNTYWSDSAYIVFGEVVALTQCDNYASRYSSSSWSSVLTNVTITLESSSVSSMCGAADFSEYFYDNSYTVGTPYPFNFYDLEGPVPASAWACRYDSADPWDTINQLFYDPVLYVSTQILAIDPSWSDCLVFELGSIDPPKALNRAPALLPATTTQYMPDPSASPGMTPEFLIATSTTAITASNQGVPPPAASHPSGSQQPGSDPPDASDGPRPGSDRQRVSGSLLPGSDPSGASGIPWPGSDRSGAAGSPPPGSDLPGASGSPQPAVTPPAKLSQLRWSAMVSSAISSMRSRAGQGNSLVIIDPSAPSVLQTLTTGDVIGAGSQTVVAFDQSNGLLVVSGSDGITRLQLRSMVVGLASKTTVLLLPRGRPTDSASAAAAAAAAAAEETVTAVETGFPIAGDDNTVASDTPTAVQSGVSATGSEVPHSTTENSLGYETKVHLCWMMLLVADLCLALT